MNLLLNITDGDRQAIIPSESGEGWRVVSGNSLLESGSFQHNTGYSSGADSRGFMSTTSTGSDLVVGNQSGRSSRGFLSSTGSFDRLSAETARPDSQGLLTSTTSTGSDLVVGNTTDGEDGCSSHGGMTSPAAIDLVMENASDLEEVDSKCLAKSGSSASDSIGPT